MVDNLDKVRPFEGEIVERVPKTIIRKDFYPLGDYPRNGNAIFQSEESKDLSSFLEMSIER